MDFLQKHLPKFEGGEMMKIKMIHKTVEASQHMLKKDKKGTEHIKKMAEAYEMMCDYFNEKGIDPKQYL